MLASILLLLLMLGALLEAQRSRSSLAAYNFDREICRDTTESLFQYVRFKLEQNQTWLLDAATSPEPPSQQDGRPLFSMTNLKRLDSKEICGRIEITGEFMQASPVDFTLAIDNNLHNKAGEYSLSPHSARITIETRYGRSSQRKSWILIHSAFSNSTLAASRDIDLQAPEIVFASTDPSRNQIRSQEDVLLPPSESIKFEPSDEWRRGEKGTVWAYDDIRLGGSSNLEQASLVTGGQFIPNGKTAYEVPVIPVSKIGADLQKDEILEIEGGHYALGRATIQVDDTEGETHEIYLPIVHVTKHDRDDLYLLRTDLVVEPKPAAVEPEDETVEGEEETSEAEEEASEAEEEVSEGEEGTPEGESPELVEVELDFNTIRIKDSEPPKRLFIQDTPNIELGGGMLVNLTPVNEETEEVLPCLVELPVGVKVVTSESLTIVGYSAAFLPTLSFTSDHPNSILEGSDRGHLESKKGSLTLGCNVENGGILIAAGSVHIFPEELDLEASSKEDLAICAGGDVHVNPYLVEAPEEFREKPGKMGIKGLLYAGGSFKFSARSMSGDEELEYNRDLEIEGSVVARGGSIFIVSAEKLILKYNPEFLDDVLEANTHYPGRQLEIASVREY